MSRTGRSLSELVRDRPRRGRPQHPAVRGRARSGCTTSSSPAGAPHDRDQRVPSRETRKLRTRRGPVTPGTSTHVTPGPCDDPGDPAPCAGPVDQPEPVREVPRRAEQVGAPSTTVRAWRSSVPLHRRRPARAMPSAVTPADRARPVRLTADAAQAEVGGAERPADRLQRAAGAGRQQPVAQAEEQRAGLDAGRVVLAAAVDAVVADAARQRHRVAVDRDPQRLDPGVLAQRPGELGHHQLDRLGRQLALVTLERDVGDARREIDTERAIVSPGGTKLCTTRSRPSLGPRSSAWIRVVASCLPRGTKTGSGTRIPHGRVEEVERDLAEALREPGLAGRSARPAGRRCATRRPRSPSGSSMVRLRRRQRPLPGAPGVEAVGVGQRRRDTAGAVSGHARGSSRRR